MEVAAGRNAEAPLAPHLFEAFAFSHRGRRMPGFDAVDAELAPIVHQRRETPPRDEEGSRVGDDGEASRLANEGDAFFKVEDGLGFVEGPTLAEKAIEGVLPAFRRLFGHEELRDVRAAYLAIGIPVLAGDGRQFFHARLDAGFVHPLENSRIAIGTGLAKSGEGFAEFPVDSAEVETEEVEFARREGNLDFDASDQADATPGRLGLGLAYSGHRIVVGKGEGGNARIGGEGDECRWRVASIARGAMAVQIDQNEPPGALSSIALPKARMMGRAFVGRDGSSPRNSDSLRAIVATASSSRGDVSPWGEGRDWV